MPNLNANGLTTCDSQPVKTLSNHAAHFIANHALPASLDVVFIAVWFVLAMQVLGALYE